MRKLLTMLTAGALLGSMLAAHLGYGANAQPKQDQASIWMKQKLAASQNILAGLTKNDFEAIGKNAKSMLAVEFLEKWIRADTPGYRVMLKDFEYANESLILAARKKNLDRATIAYVQLTLSCVKCHELVRGDSE